MHLFGRAGRLAPHQDHVLGLISELRVRDRGFRGREDKAPSVGGAPTLEGAPGGVARDRRLIEVVEARAPEVSVRDVEARRFDDLDRNAEARRHPQHGPGVLRDIGLVKSKARHRRVILPARGGVKSAVRRLHKTDGEPTSKDFAMLFDWLERRIDPFAPFEETETPPTTVAGFTWHYLKPVR